MLRHAPLNFRARLAGVGPLQACLPGLRRLHVTCCNTGSFVVLPRLDDVSLLGTAPSAKYLPQLEALVSEAFQKPSRANSRSSNRIHVDEAGQMQCDVCGKYCAKEDFYMSAGSTCKTCVRDRCQQYRRTLRGTASTLVGGARRHARKRGLSCSLTSHDILEMLLEQRGRCAKSEVPMELLLPHSHWRMSLERLDNSKGYSRENCALICAEFNSSDYSRRAGVDPASVQGTAQWSLEKVGFVGHAFSSCEVDLHKLVADVELASAAHVPHSPRLPNSCSRSSNYNVNYYKTLRGKSVTMASGAAVRSRKRGHACHITYRDILDMLVAQEGRCFYSGVPLEYNKPHRDWVMSLERLDNRFGYVENNCVLIAAEFNTADRRSLATGEVYGSSQWSLAKVMHVWGGAGCYQH